MVLQVLRDAGHQHGVSAPSLAAAVLRGHDRGRAAKVPHQLRPQLRLLGARSEANGEARHLSALAVAPRVGRRRCAP